MSWFFCKDCGSIVNKVNRHGTSGNMAFWVGICTGCGHVQTLGVQIEGAQTEPMRILLKNA